MIKVGERERERERVSVKFPPSLSLEIISRRGYDEGGGGRVVV